jgi:mannose-6-phosphate isomerase-like protein (cupin superfamily)/GNAT superfamily N-acetyltransferase
MTSDFEFEIAVDDPETDDVRELRARHLAFAREFTPSSHVHALPVEALKERNVTFYSARRSGTLVAIAALKRLDSVGAELKSMHTDEASRGQGAAGALLRHLLTTAKAQGYRQVSLETGTMDAFAPARRLYQRMGFQVCEPFASYTANPFSTCMRFDFVTDSVERGEEMEMKAIDTQAALASIAEVWSPLTIAVMNDYDVRVVKVHGEFTRHSHPETDELFFLLRGQLVIRLDDLDVELTPGQLFVVPRGMHHRPVSDEGAEVLLIEPSTTVNTGDTPSELTAERKTARE